MKKRLIHRLYDIRVSRVLAESKIKAINCEKIFVIFKQSKVLEDYINKLLEIVSDRDLINNLDENEFFNNSFFDVENLVKKMGSWVEKLCQNYELNNPDDTLLPTINPNFHKSIYDSVITLEECIDLWNVIYSTNKTEIIAFNALILLYLITLQTIINGAEYETFSEEIKFFENSILLRRYILEGNPIEGLIGLDLSGSLDTLHPFIAKTITAFSTVSQTVEKEDLEGKTKSKMDVDEKLEDNKEGIILTLKIPDRIQEEIKENYQGKLQNEELHITVVYFGKVSDFVLSEYYLLDKLTQYVNSVREPHVKVIGQDTFEPSDSSENLIPNILTLEIDQFDRDDLIDFLNRYDIPYKNDFPDWKPHITLSYEERSEDIKPFDYDRNFNVLWFELWYGKNRHLIEIK